MRIFSLSICILCILSNNSFGRTYIKTVEFKKLISKLVKNDNSEVFFTYNGTLFLDTDLNDMNKYEKILGSFKKNYGKSLRSGQTSLFNQWPFSRNETLTYYNSYSRKIERYTVKDHLEFKLFQNPSYSNAEKDTSFFLKFNLVLASEARENDFTSEESEIFNGIAVKGDKIKIKANIVHSPKNTEINAQDLSVKDLVEFHKVYQKNSNPQKVFVVKSIIGNCEYYIIGSSGQVDRSYFLRISQNNLLHWSLNSSNDVEEVQMFGDLVEGASCTGYFEYQGSKYLLVFNSQDVNLFPVWTSYSEKYFKK